MDRRDWQSPWWLYGHWLNVHALPRILTGSTEGNSTFAFEVCDTYRPTDTHSVLGIVSLHGLGFKGQAHVLKNAREQTTKSKVLWLHINDTRPTIIFFLIHKSKTFATREGKYGGRNKRDEQKSWLPLSVWRRRGLISRGGRISGLMWTLMLKQCVFIAGDHKT